MHLLGSIGKSMNKSFKHTVNLEIFVRVLVS